MSCSVRFCVRTSIVVAVLSLLPAGGHAQDLFTPHHVAKTRVVTAAVISPDGTQVAYALSVPRQLPKEKDGPSWVELHVVDAKGESSGFVTGQVNIDGIAWTPDGKNISFLAKRDKDEFRSLYLIPVRGGEAKRILSHGSDILGYSWAPDGARVAFLANEPVAKAKKTLQDQGFNQEIYEEDVSPVRVWTAVVSPSGEKAPAQLVDVAGSASELLWNPKDDRLAVALAPTPLIDDHLMFRKVNIVPLKGKALDLKNPGKIGQHAWSPDGKLLALVTGQDKHDPMQGRLWVHTTTGKDWHDVLPKFLGHVESIAWRDNSTLLYQASEGVWTTVGALDLEVAADNIIVKDRKILVPTGGPILASMTASADGKTLAFVGNAPAHPPEIFLLGEGDKQPRRLTDSNPWLKNMKLAKQEVIKHKARDGMELEGILVRPLDDKPGQRYPLVLTVHGGPEAHMSNGWVTLYYSLGQVGAARGMAVFYPNYRGSTGRGVEFSMLGQAAAAGKEFDDLVDAVDHLIGIGLVDKKKVGITGGSYGGYATAWGSTYYSERFAAGVMFVGISDSVSKVGTTDIPQEMFLVHHRKWLWDDWNYFLKSSPIYHVDKSTTPLLILHGKADPRVHPSQSLELHRHLKVRGKAPVRLVLYPGEGHGNRRAASRLDYNLRMLQWMEHYLRGPGGAPPPFQLDYGLQGKSAALPTTHTLGWNTRRPQDEAGFPWLGRDCPCCIRP